MKTSRFCIAALTILFLAFIEVFSATEQIFSDDFETEKGWTVDPYGTDDATTGMWERANPEGTYYQIDVTPGTGYNDLVTGALAGSSYGSYDIDDGKTSIRSPDITLPDYVAITLTFKYYLAHANNSSSADYLRVKIVDASGDHHLVFEELGASNTDYPSWEVANVDISGFKDQAICLLIEAADESEPSLVEAGIDDVLIEATTPPSPPSEWDYSVQGQITTDAHVGVGGNLSVGNILTVKEIRGIGLVDPFKIIEPQGTIDVMRMGAMEIFTSDLKASNVEIDGPLYAREVNVTLEDFPDYVFTNGHKLKSLDDLEKYIKENGHLPNIPTQREVKENGLNIGKMQAKLIEKIEEMTLYMIKIQKRIDELEAKQNERK